MDKEQIEKMREEDVQIGNWISKCVDKGSFTSQDMLETLKRIKQAGYQLPQTGKQLDPPPRFDDVYYQGLKHMNECEQTDKREVLAKWLFKKKSSFPNPRFYAGWHDEISACPLTEQEYLELADQILSITQPPELKVLDKETVEKLNTDWEEEQREYLLKHPFDNAPEKWEDRLLNAQVDYNNRQLRGKP